MVNIINMKFLYYLMFVLYLVSSFPQGTLTQGCGTFRAYEPTIAGHTIRFAFYPTSGADASTVRWFIAKGDNWTEMPPNNTRGNVTTYRSQSMLDYTTYATETRVVADITATQCVGERFEIDLTNDCGRLTFNGPAITGWTVRFQLKPYRNMTDTSVEWYTVEEGIASFVKYATKVGEKFILHYKTTTGQRAVTIFAKMQSCSSPAAMVDIKDDCRRQITLDEPGIAGRYIRFRLAHSGSVTNPSVLWHTLSGGVASRIDSTSATFNTSYIGDEFILDYKTATHQREVSIFAETPECYSQPFTADVKEANIDNCGVLYKHPEFVLPGEDVELRYYPAKAILDKPKDFVQEWRFRSPNCARDGEYGCRVPETVGKFEATTETFYGDPEYKLLIKALDSQKDGTYFVMCKENTYTLLVNITTPVKPSKPKLPFEKNGDFCTGGCLVGKINEVYTIQCETHGGTDSEVDIYINDVKKSVYFVGKYYEAKETLYDADHNVKVRCEARNRAFPDPQVTETTLYIAKEPSTPVLHMNEIKEDFPVNVTCSSTGGRPPARLNLEIVDVDGSLNVSMSSQTTEEVVTSIARLNKVERQWNGKKLKCCTNHVVYGRSCAPGEVIDYKFPPSNVSLYPPSNITAIKKTYTLNVTCSVFMFNAKCEAGWKINGVNVSHYVALDGKRESHSPMTSSLTQTVQIVVSKADNKKNIECFANCSEFPEAVKKRDSWTIAVPYQPEVSFYPAKDTISLAEGDSFTVKCLVDSYPAATISWIRETDGAALPTERCGPGADSCSLLSLELVTGNMRGTYICRAKNPLSANVTKRRLHIVVYETETRYSEKQSTDGDTHIDGLLMPVVIGLSAFVMLFGVIIVVIVVRRRSARKKESYSAANAVDENETNGGSPNQAQAQAQAQGGAEGAESYATYATPLPKSQRPGATGEGKPTQAQGDDTYAMPLPKSQRPNASPTAAQATPGAPKELIYADLDLQPSTSGGDQNDKSKPRIIGESETEYVDIDFSKKAATESAGTNKENLNKNEKEDKVYANQ